MQIYNQISRSKPKAGATLLMLSLALSLLLVSPATAGEAASQDFDANGDGKITFAEVMKKLERSARTTFDAMDHNKDGVLSSKDFGDVQEGVKKLEDWLHDLLKPFMQDDESQDGPMAV